MNYVLDNYINYSVQIFYLSVSIYLLVVKWINNQGNVFDLEKQMIDVIFPKITDILLVTNISYDEIYLSVYP